MQKHSWRGWIYFVKFWYLFSLRMLCFCAYSDERRGQKQRQTCKDTQQELPVVTHCLSATRHFFSAQTKPPPPSHRACEINPPIWNRLNRILLAVFWCVFSHHCDACPVTVQDRINRLAFCLHAQFYGAPQGAGEVDAEQWLQPELRHGDCWVVFCFLFFLSGKGEAFTVVLRFDGDCTRKGPVMSRTPHVQ